MKKVESVLLDQVHIFIDFFLAENQHTPTNREIGKHFGINSTSAVDRILSKLEGSGAIMRDPGKSRNIRLLKRPLQPKSGNTIYVRLVGTTVGGLGRDVSEAEMSGYESEGEIIAIDLSKLESSEYFCILYKKGGK